MTTRDINPKLPTSSWKTHFGVELCDWVYALFSNSINPDKGMVAPLRINELQYEPLHVDIRDARYTDYGLNGDRLNPLIFRAAAAAKHRDCNYGVNVIEFEFYAPSVLASEPYIKLRISTVIDLSKPVIVAKSSPTQHENVVYGYQGVPWRVLFMKEPTVEDKVKIKETLRLVFQENLNGMSVTPLDLRGVLHIEPENIEHNWLREIGALPAA